MLSDEKIDRIAKAYKATMLGEKPYFPWFDFARAIEAAVLKEAARKRLEAQGITCFTSNEPRVCAPVVQPDMVLLPREPTEEMLEVIRNERGAYGTGEALYADLIAAAEGKK